MICIINKDISFVITIKIEALLIVLLTLHKTMKNRKKNKNTCIAITMGWNPFWSCILIFVHMRLGCWVSSSIQNYLVRFNHKNEHYTLGGIASICFKSHFQQTLRIQIQGFQGCQKIRKIVRNTKIPIARSTIHPSLSKIKNHYWKTSKIQ